ncbi:hypothetical protein MP228_004344 [Amoeboaphelidium protococcarum]|nr:hypothetical protein MP228_004344 [Amoeboaphelidium protococcarum]
MDIDINELVKQYGQRDELFTGNVDPERQQRDGRQAEVVDPEELAETFRQQETELMEQLQQQGSKRRMRTTNYSPTDTKKVGKYVAIDCEMVGIGANGLQSALARVSIVNYHGHVLLDTYVKCHKPVTDYRTAVSGILPHHLKDGRDFRSVQRQVYALIRDKIVVGHSVHSDFKALQLSHPPHMIRDTSRYAPFRKLTPHGRTPGLKLLCEKVLQKEIQNAASTSHSVGHCSIEDARSVMELFKTVKLDWDKHCPPPPSQSSLKKSSSRKQQQQQRMYS